MSVATSPSSSRGEIILQPAYFTSSAFVHAARADIDRLIQQYTQQYTRSRNHPFTLFKEIWQGLGWTWIQFKVFDARSRAAFLRVVLRLFSERIGSGETPLNRAAALFGLYTLLRAQPSASAPSLYSAAQVEVTCDLYEEMLMLPDALDGESLRAHVVYVQSDLLQTQVFRILPHAGTHPLSPRVLPREVVAEDAEDATSRKKRGRPSKRERIKKARESLVALDGWREDGSGPSGTRDGYAMAKKAFVDGIGGRAGALRAAGGVVAERVGGLMD